MPSHGDGQADFSDLLKINEVTSRDYNPLVTQALQNGKVTDFLGFRFVPAEIGNNTARLRHRRGADGRRLRLSPLPGVRAFRHALGQLGRVLRPHQRARRQEAQHWQIYAETCGAATRVNEDKCFQMLCLES
jgi:hypothetical protein